MSLSLESSVSYEAPYFFESNENPSAIDTVLVPTHLWNRVGPHNSSSICLALTARPSSQPWLICRAVPDEQIDDIAIPAQWSRRYPRIFPGPSNRLEDNNERGILTFSIATPIPVTRVIVVALSTEAFQAAPLHLEGWFCTAELILRQGDIHTFSSEDLRINGHGAKGSHRKYQYRISLVEPVLQGCVRKDFTEFIVTSSKHQLGINDYDSKAVLSPEREGSYPEGIEIDEYFLANATLSSMPSAAEQESSHMNELLDEYQESSTNMSFNATFDPQPLTGPVDECLDHCTLYIRTSDFGRIGLLNGDWALARSRSQVNYRLVRVVANDNVVEKIGRVAGSPVLLHNIISSSCDSLCRTVPPIVLCPTPFGSRLPPIPVARSVHVARIASPFSNARKFEPVLLHALRAYFVRTRCLVKRGDVIAIAVDSDVSNFLHELPSQEVDVSIMDSVEARPWTSSNEIAFFLITNAEYDAMKNNSVIDAYTGSTVGEMGCWIDASTTRIVQTGVQHMQRPNVGQYFLSGTSAPAALYRKLVSQDASHLLGAGSPFHELVNFASATLARNSVDYGIKLSVLIKGPRGVGKFTVISWAAQYLGMHLLEVDCFDLLGPSDLETKATLLARIDNAKSCSPCFLVFRHVEALIQTTQNPEPGKESSVITIIQQGIDDLQGSWRSTGFPVVLLGTSSDASKLPTSLTSSFKHDITIETPGEPERSEILRALLLDSTLSPDVSVAHLATHTAALVASDLVDLVVRASDTSIGRSMQATGLDPVDLMKAGVALTDGDFENALKQAKLSYSENIGAPKIPAVTWDDVGGLEHAKADIFDTIQLPLEHPELFIEGFKKRSGILLYGPPGTGKTLLAKAVATSFSLNFFSVKGPELLNMYIGESEANVRRVFQRARDARPCVIFFDELDSVAPKRGQHGDSGGVIDRIVSQLLAELDGMSGSSSGADVFVIGATNRPDLLDPALLRPGRFDRMLYLGVSETHEAQAKILEALTRKFRLDPKFDLHSFARRCPLYYTGADFYALCSDALLYAMSRKAEEIEEKIEHLNRLPGPYEHPYPLTPQYYLAEMASPGDVEVLVSSDDFERALKALIPSVSESETRHYAQIRSRFSRGWMEDST